MKQIPLIVGVISILLGGLWLLQGLGLVQVRPVLCFVDCAAVQGPSSKWAIVGFIVVAFGCLTLYRWLKRLNRR